MEALNRMYHSNVSSVAVLNAEGLLVGNISLSDVKVKDVLMDDRSINPHLFWSLVCVEKLQSSVAMGNILTICLLDP